MSDSSENLHLFYLQGSNPREYRLSLEIGLETLEAFIVEQFNTESTTPNSNTIHYNVEVQMAGIPQGYSELSIDLGPLNLPSSNVWFNLTIIDNNNNQICHGSIRIEEGEQETRPI